MGLIGGRIDRRRDPLPLAWIAMAAERLSARVPAAVAVPLIAAAAFTAGWWLLGVLAAGGFFGSLMISDTPVYLEAGDRIVAGLIPYRDFPMEYPPAALPIFLLPSLLTPAAGDVAAYTRIFEWLMLGCGAAAAAATARTIQLVGAGAVRLGGSIAFMAIAPILVGPVLLSHFDLWPAALTALALAAIASRHERIGAGILGVAVMAKIYPVVVVPLLAAAVWRRAGREEALRILAIVAGVMLAIVGPFVLLAPGGVLDALARQATRPLQVETLGASALYVLHGLTGLVLVMGTGSGSQNLLGPLPDALAALETVALVVSTVAIWAWFARGRPTPRRFLQGVVAAIVAYIAFGKVLSPQYIAWLIPLVPLLGGRRGAVAGALALVAFWLTGDYFPKSYFPYIQDTDRTAAWIVLLRNVSLVALLATAALPVGRMWRGGVVAADRLRLRDPVRAIAAQPVQALLVLLVGFFVLRAVWITKPEGALIFDETYYVNAARVIDGLHPPAGQPYADAPLHLDPNTEHPPLGKAAIAASIRLLGDNAFAWRLPSIVAALIALAAVYGIVIAAGETAWLGILAVAILGLDNLTFVHGRIGTLDMMATAAILVGAWLGLRGRPSLAGVAFGVGSLIKVTAFFGYLAFVLAHLVVLVRRHRRGARISLRRLQPLVYGSVAYAVVGLGGLAILDRLFTTFASPLDHLRQMLGYGIALTGGPSPTGIASNPWDWLVGAGRFDYLRVDVSVLANGATVSTYPTIEFQGALNPVLIGAAPLAVLFGIWLAVRRRHRLAGWALIWLAANYLPYYGLAIAAHRIMYLYYALPAVPAVAVLTAIFLLRAQLPRLLAFGYLALSAAAFIAYFPFRQLP